MAATAKTVELNVQSKTPIGNGKAIYQGTVLGGAEYTKGGMAIKEETGSRFPMPTKFDYFNAPTALFAHGTAAIGSNLIKVLANGTVTNKKSGFVELEEGETLATAFATIPFVAIGAQ